VDQGEEKSDYSKHLLCQTRLLKPESHNIAGSSRGHWIERKKRIIRALDKRIDTELKVDQ